MTCRTFDCKYYEQYGDWRFSLFEIMPYPCCQCKHAYQNEYKMSKSGKTEKYQI